MKREASKRTPAPRAAALQDSERTLVGAMLLDSERVLRLLRAARITADNFTDDTCRRVFGAVVRLADAGRPVEPVAVQREAGVDAATVQKVIDDCPTAASCEYHIAIVQAGALKRRAQELVGQAEGVEALRMACERIKKSLPGGARGAGFTVRSWGEVLDAIVPPRRFFLGDLFGMGQVQVVFGQGGLGKSRLATNLARNQVLGVPFLGVETGAGAMRHLFIGSENDIHRWQIDFKCMTRGQSAADRDKLASHIRVTTLEHAEDSFINLGDERNVDKWRDTLRAWPPDVLWCDPWGDIIEGDGFDRDVRSTIGTLRKLAREVNPDCGIVILAHARTGASNIAQATGFDAANFGKDSKALFSCARAAVNVAPFDAGENPDLCWIPAKNNNGRRPEPLRIRLDSETLTYSVVEPLDVEGWQASVKQAAKTTWQRTSAKFDADAVLGLLTTPITRTELQAAVQGLGVTQREARAGIDGLLRTGRLEERKAGNRNTKLLGTPQSFQNHHGR